MSAMAFAGYWLAIRRGRAEQSSPMPLILTICACSHSRSFVEGFGVGLAGMQDQESRGSRLGSCMGTVNPHNQGDGGTLMELMGVLPEDHMHSL